MDRLITLNIINKGNADYYLKQPIDVHITGWEYGFQAYNRELDIEGFGETEDKALEDFVEEFDDMVYLLKSKKHENIIGYDKLCAEYSKYISL